MGDLQCIWDINNSRPEHSSETRIDNMLWCTDSIVWYRTHVAKGSCCCQKCALTERNHLSMQCAADEECAEQRVTLYRLKHL